MTSTCEFTVMIPGQAVTRPKSGQEVIITSQLGREFAGHIVTVKEAQNNSVITQLDYKVTVRDYAYLLDRHVAFNEFAANTYTYDQIVKTLVQQYGAADGFTTTGVQASFEAVYTRFDYQGVSQSINQMAQQIAWAFYVDYFKNVFFYDGTTSIPSPLPSNTLLVDTATTLADAYNIYGAIGVYGDLEITEDSTQLRTKIFLYGHQVTAGYFLTESFTGDDSTTSFGLTYPPSQDLVNNVIVTVGGATYTPAVDLVDGVPTSTAQDFTAYINFTGQTVRFNVPPPDGVAVVVEYKPQLPLVVVIPSPSDAALTAAVMDLPASDPYFEYAISDPSLSAETIGPSQARADEQLTKYGTARISGTFTSYLHGWKAGTFFLLTSTKRFDGQFNATTMYVTKVDKKIVSHPTNAGATQPLFKSTISFSDSVYVI